MDNNGDNYIRIDTRLDTSKLPDDVDKAIELIEKRLDYLKEKEKEAFEIDGIKVTGVSNLTQEEADEYNNLIQLLQELKQRKEGLIDVNGELTASQEALLQKGENAGINGYIEDAEKLKKEYSELVQAFEEQGIDLNSYGAKKKLEELKDEFDTVKRFARELFGVDIGNIEEAEQVTKKISINVEEIKKSLDGIGTGVNKTIKKVLKWGLAIFSVRSAYMFVRQAASTLSQYNEDLKNKIEGIRLALASSLEPIIKRLVDWVITLLKYVNAISMALFKWDLFKNAKNMKSMSKSAKEIKNSLASFDEKNVLSNNSSSGSAGSNFNYDDLYFGEEKPGWIEWIENNADAIKDFLTFVLAFGVAFKALSLFKDLLAISNLQLWGLAAALALTLKGIYDLVKGIKEFIEDPSWENFSKILAGLGEILVGIGIALAIIFASNPVGWIMIVIGAVAMLSAYLIKHRKEIKERFIDNLKRDFESLIGPIKQVVDGIIKIVNGDLKGGLLSIVKGIANGMINVLNTLIRGINRITTPIRGMIVAIGKVLGKSYTMDNIKIPEIPKLATGGIINRPTYAQIGENGREAVLPLDRNTQWIDELAKKINSTGSGVVNVYLDGRLIQRTISQREEELNFATNGGM